MKKCVSLTSFGGAYGTEAEKIAANIGFMYGF